MACRGVRSFPASTIHERGGSTGAGRWSGAPDLVSLGLHMADVAPGIGRRLLRRLQLSTGRAQLLLQPGGFGPRCIALGNGTRGLCLLCRLPSLPSTRRSCHWDTRQVHGIHPSGRQLCCHHQTSPAGQMAAAGGGGGGIAGEVRGSRFPSPRALAFRDPSSRRSSSTSASSADTTSRRPWSAARSRCSDVACRAASWDS